MTACNDVQSASFGKKAVSAALAGTLAVGMVPGVALAATADGAEAGDGISTLALTAAQDFDGGSVTGLTIGGTAVSVANGKATVKALSSDAADKDLVVTQVTTSQGTVINYDAKKAPWTVTVTTDKDGKTAATDYTTTVGTYYVNITAAGDYTGGTLQFELNVTGNSLVGTTAYEVADDEKDVSDTTFTYNAAAQDLGFTLNGKVLSIGDTSADAIKSVAWYKGTGPNAEDLQEDGDWTPTAAGTYTAVLTGNGAAGFEGTTGVVVTVDKLDLTKADIDIPATTDGTWTITSINGIKTKDLIDQVTPELTKSPTDLPGDESNGQYTFTVAPTNPKNENITGSQTVTSDRVGSETVTWFYGSNVVDSTTFANAINYANGDAAFDISKLYAAKETVTTLPAANERLAYTYTVKDAKGNVVANSSLTQPGKWTVTATVDSAACGYEYGGETSFTITVINGVVNSQDIIVKQDGKVTATPTFTYNGTDVLSQLDITVKCGDKVLTQGTDYTLSVENDDTNKTVNEAVNAGAYTVSVVSNAYDIADNEFKVTVSKLAITGLQVAGQIVDPVSGAKFIPYTGEAITPVIEYTTSDAADVAAGKATWQTLPADLYALSYGSGVKEMKEKGNYTLTITANPESEVAANYTWLASPANELGVTVATGGSLFKDVNDTDWFYDVVNQAAQNGYMNGYAGTPLFGPNDKITRGQVACVLFNMAGGTLNGSDISYSETNGWETGFSDVNGNMYYAKAIAWAKQAGVVNGYAGTDKFGPNDNVTREQFAAMLANYAKAFNNFKTVEDIATVLASKADGSQVSDWAKESVAWAVDNKYMANGGVINPLGNITRAEVAAMAINYQPEPMTAKAPVAVTGITATVAAGAKFTPGATVNVTVAVAPDNAANAKWTAASSDTDVATVNATTGAITVAANATAGDTAKITYTAAGDTSKTAVVDVTVVSA